ncbi:uncharacterized protein LOC108629922 [Ceratina calcarata]|uniref:Uncharacterized protein LOC108629922 n=1 Tax=Ceratina calcarata TaxID=156304 RepID=A0AAJ7NCC9_9HYME|nr:uncharacterized protein LOC108629922 [Ceratina calcarata]
MEEVSSSSKSNLTNEEQECKDHFKSTHFRDSEGRYVVRLPFRKSTELLGDSKAKALRMLSPLLKKFQTDSILQQAYTMFLSYYETLNHMLPVDKSNESKHSYYLPHHGVIRESSVSTKLRVVFNALSLTSVGVSLNDVLHNGENFKQNFLMF